MESIISVRETAQILDPRLNYVYDAIYRAEIKALRLDRRIVVPKGALHQMLKNPSLVRQLSKPSPDDGRLTAIVRRCRR